MRKLFLVLLMLPSITLTAQAEIVERILAVVNDGIITQSDMNDYREKLKGGALTDDLLGTESSKLLKDDKALLNHMINEKVLDSEVKRQNLQVTIERVEQEINSIQARNNITRDQLRQALRAERTTFAEYQDFVKKRLERQAVIEKAITSKIKISDEEARSAYSTQTGAPSGQIFEYKIAHILVRRGTPQEIQKRAAQVLAKLKLGHTFEDLSTQYSEDPNYQDGGLLGTFKQGEFLKPLEDAISTLNKGEYAGPVKTKLGVHVVKLLDRKTVADPEFEKRKEEIKNQLYQKAFERQFRFWLEQRRQESFIRINYPHLS